ncbi:MAG: DNA-binding transcriptional regulator [Chitinophagaceae bacterium]|nr:DNA-binding transcriptional regulator [Chitinophagaceae bacterium]
MIKIVLLLDFSEEYHKKLLSGIVRYSREFGPWTFFRMPIYYRETLGIDGILQWAKDWGAKGLIGQLHGNSEIWKFTNAKISVIAQDFDEPFKGVPNITGAYHETGRMGAKYFLKKGFKNFAFYGFKDIVWSRERAKGFEQEVKEAGYTVHYFEQKRNRSADLWYYKPSALSKWLKTLPKPVALMTCDDNQSLHITQASKHIGIRIPEEIAVLGVDNDENICFLSDPPLSSIAVDVERGGYEAAGVMQQMIAGRKKKFGDIVIKPTHVVTRASTDIYSSNDMEIVGALKYIHTNIDKNLKVYNVLKQVPLSRRVLEKRFIDITGVPVYKYIYNLRIEKFTEKLLRTDMTITEICYELGLNDAKNITRLFKQVKGLTPLEYRKKYSIK